MSQPSDPEPRSGDPAPTAPERQQAEVLPRSRSDEPPASEEWAGEQQGGWEQHGGGEQHGGWEQNGGWEQQGDRGQDGGHGPEGRSRSGADGGAGSSVLDEPPDDRDLAERLRRPGIARSTRILLFVLAAVVLFGLGGLVGRATAPDTGPGSVPSMVGTVESVDANRTGFPVITLRGPDGGLTALRTSGATVVAVPQGDPSDVRAGQQVTIASEREADGALTATRVDVPPGR